MVLRGALIELFFPGQDEGVSHSENTAVTELHWENGSYELISLNDATHLTPELSTLGRQNWWRGSRYLDFNMWYRDVAPEDAPLLACAWLPADGAGRPRSHRHAARYSRRDGRHAPPGRR